MGLGHGWLHEADMQATPYAAKGDVVNRGMYNARQAGGKNKT